MIAIYHIDHGGMKIHYNGTTTDFIKDSVPELIGNQTVVSLWLKKTIPVPVFVPFR